MKKMTAPHRHTGSALALLTTLLLLTSCLTEDTEIAVPDVVDKLTGSTWIRPGFKSPINGKNVYYYFTFRKNKQIESYVKLDKVEMQANPPETGSYVIDTTATETDVTRLKIFLMAIDYDATIVSDKLTLKAKNGELTYFKE